MIYLPGRFVFIHIPRTAGISIKATLSSVRAVSNHALINNCDHPAVYQRHTRVVGLEQHIPDWDAIKKFAFYRSDEEIFKSDYRLHKQDQESVDHMPDSAWKESVVRSMEETEEQFVERRRNQYKQGMWHHYCKSHKESPIERFQFDDIENEWKRLLDWLEIPYLPLLHLNRTQ